MRLAFLVMAAALGTGLPETAVAADEGVNIAAPGAARGPVAIWPEDKVARALASVAFR